MRYNYQMPEQEQGLLVVISGPSGVGKTTIVHKVQDAFDAVFSVSATTRPQSTSEVNGKDYFFITPEEFNIKIKNNEFLEHAEVFGCHHYGTLKKSVTEVLSSGRIMLLDIDVQGGVQIQDNMPESIRIFILKAQGHFKEELSGKLSQVEEKKNKKPKVKKRKRKS